MRWVEGNRWSAAGLRIGDGGGGGVNGGVIGGGVLVFQWLFATDENYGGSGGSLHWVLCVGSGCYCGLKMAGWGNWSIMVIE